MSPMDQISTAVQINPMISTAPDNNRDKIDASNRINKVNQTNYPVSQFNRNNLSRLSNQELESKLKDLVTKERKLLHVILEHIKEVATRRLYLERAYSSLFEYLVKELGYSGSAAMRRIEAARLLREVPAVAQKIQEGSLNLSQIGELSRAIKEKEKTTGEQISALRKENLVEAISGKSTQETQKELCNALDIQIQERERQRIQKDDSVRLELTFSKKQYEKLSQCRDLLVHVLQQNQKDYSWASVIEALTDQYLSKKTDTSADINQEKVIANAVAGHSKSLTPKMKAAVLRRDRCCQFVDPLTQKKCGSSFGLQIDHRTSLWAGGHHIEANLQVLCQWHNRLKYQKESGIRFVSS